MSWRKRINLEAGAAMRLPFGEAGGAPNDDDIADTRPDAEGELVVYATTWCGDCFRTRRFLNRHQIPHRWIDVDRDPNAALRVLQINGGHRSVPTLIFPDGSVLTEPSDRDLAV